MANINKISVAGTIYDIQDKNASKTVELTQAEYDGLAVKEQNTFYIITDAAGGDLSNYYTKQQTDTLLGEKQPTLVSGTNIKTINNESLLGEGNIDIQGGGSITVDTELSTTSENPVQNKVVTAALNNKVVSLQWDLTGSPTKHIQLRLYGNGSNNLISSDNLNLGAYLQYGSPEASKLCITGLTSTIDFEAHIADTTAHVTSDEKTAWNSAATALGGLKLVKLSQSEYDALQTKDANTLFIIVN